MPTRPKATPTAGPTARTSSRIPKEQEAFKAKYGYDYSIPPKDYNEFADMSEFFFRPDANPPMYGAAVYTQKDYDAITMGFQNALFTYGCDWNKDFKVDGVVNEPECVEALEAYKKLYDSRPSRQHQQLLPRDERLLHQRAGDVRDELLRLPAGAGQRGHRPELLRQGRLLLATRRAPTASSSPRWAARAPASTAYIATSASRHRFDFLKWFASDEIQRSGRSWAATPATRRPWPPRHS